MANKILYISRIDRENRSMHCWRVSIRRRGIKVAKVFTDSVWGGKREALAAARQYRDEILRLIPPLTKLEYANRKRKNNTSGAVGVCRVLRGVSFFWIAGLQLPNGRKLTASFPESKYGADQAKTLAIQARQEMLRQVDGAQCFVPGHAKVSDEVASALPGATRVEHPHALTARIARYVSGKGFESIQVRVSNGTKVETKQFREGFHGKKTAYLLAVQTAKTWVAALGGPEALRRFERDPATKVDQLPEDGIRFKMWLTKPVGTLASKAVGKSKRKSRKEELPAERGGLPRMLRVRIVRYQLKRKNNAGFMQMYMQASNGEQSISRTFSLDFHGEDMAFRYARHAALKAARLLGGPKACAIFEKDYVRELSQLPEEGIRARIPLLS